MQARTQNFAKTPGPVACATQELLFRSGGAGRASGSQEWVYYYFLIRLTGF